MRRGGWSHNACTPSADSRMRQVWRSTGFGVAKAVAVRLYEEFGFDAVDAGPLSEGWRFERGRPAYCVRFGKADLQSVLAATTRDGPLSA